MAPIQYHLTRQSAANYAVAVLALIDPSTPTRRVRTAKRKGEDFYFSMLLGDDGVWRPLEVDARVKATQPRPAQTWWAAFRDGQMLSRSITSDREGLFFEANGDWVGCELRQISEQEAGA